VADEVLVNGDVKTINGSIECDPGTDVKGDLGTINGSIHLEKTTVGGGLSTYTGNIILAKGSAVEEDIVIKRSSGYSRRRRTLTIKILEGSQVSGDVIVRDRRRKVTVTISSNSRVEGEIKGATVEKI
jgi:hypothetical protein